MSTSIENVAGIGPATATLLSDKGIHSAEDLAATQVGDLAAIKGFNTIRAGQVIDAAKQLTGAAVSDNPVSTDKPVQKNKDKDKKDKKKKKKKKTKDQTDNSLKSEKKKSAKAGKKSSPKKDKNKAEGSKKKSAKKK